MRLLYILLVAVVFVPMLCAYKVKTVVIKNIGAAVAVPTQEMNKATYYFDTDCSAGKTFFKCVTLTEQEKQDLKNFIKPYADDTQVVDILAKAKGTTKKVLEDFISQSSAAVTNTIATVKATVFKQGVSSAA